jgi:hypothetical protein
MSFLFFFGLIFFNVLLEIFILRNKSDLKCKNNEVLSSSLPTSNYKKDNLEIRSDKINRKYQSSDDLNKFNQLIRRIIQSSSTWNWKFSWIINIISIQNHKKISIRWWWTYEICFFSLSIRYIYLFKWPHYHSKSYLK